MGHATRPKAKEVVMADEKTATNWKPQTRIVAGGGIGLAVANILAYYFQFPTNVEASVAVLVTTLAAYFWPGDSK